MSDWKQKADAMRTEIEKLRTIFAQMAAMAESLEEKLKKQNEASMRVSAAGNQPDYQRHGGETNTFITKQLADSKL